MYIHILGGITISIEEVVRKIPSSSREAVSESLIDIVLNSKKASKMPSGLAKTILYYWQRDQLASEVGLQRLLEASISIDPEKTFESLRELGLQAIIVPLKNY
jgi:hypothetical protein